MLISSAGQFGRGGNVTIDGMDNNDDVVGGPLLNVRRTAVQEFQIATSRFSAELGRSAGSVINVVTRSGGDQLRGSASTFFRDDSLQALPATLDKSAGDTVPFDRQQYAGSVGGPLEKDTLFWFGAIEYRNQDGAVLVGMRDAATRTITRGRSPPAPADDLLGTARARLAAAAPQPADGPLLGRERGRHRPANAAIGPSGRRRSGRQPEYYNAVLGTWTRILSRRVLNALSVSVSTFHNAIDPTSPVCRSPRSRACWTARRSACRRPRPDRWQFADT